MKEKLWLILFCLCEFVFPRILSADDFRIETKIFVGGNNSPAAENLTLFFENDVYDFHLGKELGEITIYNSARERFILLDPIRRVKTSISIKELLQITTEMKITALQRKVPLVRFAADPKFKIVFDEKQERLAMTSSYLSYVLRTEKLTDIYKRQQYKRFSDAYTYLNATQHALPVQARLEVNKELDARERIPTHVTRTIVDRGKKYVARSQHKIDWEIKPDDSKRIKNCEQLLTNFKEISFNKYRPAPLEAKRNNLKKR